MYLLTRSTNRTMSMLIATIYVKYDTHRAMCPKWNFLLSHCFRWCAWNEIDLFHWLYFHIRVITHKTDRTTEIATTFKIRNIFIYLLLV